MEPVPLPATDFLYESAPCGLLAADAKGLVLRVNDTMCRLLQFTAGELVGRVRFQDLLTMGGRIFHQTHLLPLLRMQGSVAEVKVELVRKDGTVVPVIVNAIERPHESRVMVLIAVFLAEDRDRYERELVRQRRRAEELLAQHERDQRDLAAARAEATDRARLAEEMVGIVSHDLRNPLSVIQMSTALLAATGLTPGQKTVTDRIARSATRAGRLLADLLDFTQVRVGGVLPVRREPVDVHAVIAEMVPEWATAFGGREFVHRKSGTGQVLADADRLVQATGNLVANAVNHGDASKPITVATTERADGGIDIAVHNSGPAIRAEVQQTLFEPMVRGDDAGATRGVGLGLYIVRAIALAHGGTVSVRSREGEGTTFTISLPAGPMLSATSS